MKIFYQEEKTIPLGDFKFRKIAFGIEDNVDYQMETADQAIERIRAKVLDVLEAASKDAPKGKAAVSDKSKVKDTKEIMQETTEQKEFVKETVKLPVSNNDKVLTIYKAIDMHNSEYAKVIRAKLDSLKITIKDATEEQLEHFIKYLNEMMKQWNIVYKGETNKIAALLNADDMQPKKVEEDHKDGWADV